MTHTSVMYGWDLLYSSVESVIAKKDDILIMLLHWSLTKSGFRCIGVGSEKAFNSSEVGSETLPKEWNNSPDGNYALRYINDKILYILCGTRTHDVLVLNLLRCSDYAVSSVTFSVEEVVASLKGTLEIIAPTYQNILSVVKNELIGPVYEGSPRAVHTQTVRTDNANPNRQSPHSFFEDTDPDPLRVGQPRRPLPSGFEPIPPSWDPLNVGHSDLDPLGRGPLGGGGGMMFNPFGPGRRERPPGSENLPRGAVPPGARFDPFGPIGPGPIAPGPGRPQRPGGFQPDPDHLPPPGYDDMFM